MNNKYLLTYLLFFLLNIMQIKAQPLESKKLDRQKWNDLKRDLNYDENNKPINWTNNFDDTGNASGSNKMDDNTQKKQTNQKKGFGKYSQENQSGDKLNTQHEEFSNNSESEDSGQTQNIPKWLSTLLLIILGLILAIVLLWILLKYRPATNTKIKASVEKENLDDTIEKPLSELEILIDSNIKNKDYRLAIRIYFVFIIKLLKENNLINWEKKKTNTAYLKEMQNNNHYIAFYNSVNIFEMIWYGKRELNEDEFYKVQPLFKNFIEKISKT